LLLQRRALERGYELLSVPLLQLAPELIAAVVQILPRILAIGVRVDEAAFKHQQDDVVAKLLDRWAEMRRQQITEVGGEK
jgi:hypothetical protein